MNMKIIGISLTVVVSIIVLAGVLMPILDDSTTTERIFKNVGYYDMTYSESESATFEWNYLYPRTLTVNGDSVTLPEPSGTERTIICGDAFIITYSSNANGERLRFYDAEHAVTANVSGSSVLTLSCASGSYTVTVGTTSYSGSYSELFYIDTDGGYVMKDSNTPAYVSGDSKITIMDWTSVGSATVGVRVVGSIDDGLTYSTFRGEGYTFSNQNVVSSEDAEYKDLYSVGDISLTISDGSNTKNKVFSAYIVPAEVTAEKAVHLSDNEISIINAIPIMVIIAILVGIVAAIISRRMD